MFVLKIVLVGIPLIERELAFLIGEIELGKSVL